MTITEALALGRRMMACGGAKWQWRQWRAIHDVGDAYQFGIVLEVDDGMALWRADGSWGDAPGWVPLDSVTPDPRDPGVVGHALAMMRAAADRPLVCICPIGSRGWLLEDSNGDLHPAREPYPTEVEAIVAAWGALS